MAKRVQLIRHAAGTADSFTGRIGEITVDLTAKELRLHDGLTAGGVATARKDLANVLTATIAIAGKMSAAQVVELTAATAAIAAATADIASEIIDRIADVDAEETRALAAEALMLLLDGSRNMTGNLAILKSSPMIQSRCNNGGTNARLRATNSVNLSGLDVVLASNDQIIFRRIDSDGGNAANIFFTGASDQQATFLDVPRSSVDPSNALDLTRKRWVDSELASVEAKFANLNTKIIEIGDWDMTSTFLLNVAHGLTASKIRAISALIRTDDNPEIVYDYSASDNNAAIQSFYVFTTNIRFQTAAGGFFDTTSFNATSYNRGWITIQYTD